MFGKDKGNSTCPLPKDESSLLLVGEPIVGSLTFQHLILIISIACAGATAVLTLWLILKHLHRYTRPNEQRQIIRIIFTPVVFAALSVLAILNYNAANYLTPLQDLYEGFALASLFLLFTQFVAPDEDTREAYFFNLENRKKRGSKFSRSKEYDVVPGGSLMWFKSKWVAIFGYCIVMVITTAAEEITQAVGVYCETSLNPRFAQIWIMLIQNVAVTVAVTSVLQYYARLYPEMKEHKPLAKLISLKAIVGVNFIQSLAFSLLTGNDLLKGSHKVTGKDLTYGIPAMLVAFEQVLFSIAFHFSFRSREYHESEKPSTGRMGTFRAAAHAFNPYDLLSAMVYAVTLAVGGVGPRDNGEWRKQKKGRGGNYGKVFEQDNVHLEPLSGMAGPQRTDGGYGYQGFPGEESQQYLAPQGYQRPRSASQTYRPPPDYEIVQDSEAASLYPSHKRSMEAASLYPSHARSHSRDPSVDATSMREMV